MAIVNQPRSPKALSREMWRYTYIRNVGAGSFGAAILVEREGVQFIAKEMNIGKMSQKEREAVDSEVRILSALQHPNIIRYEECVHAGHVIYIIMEFADGGDLYQKISSLKEPMEESEVLYIFTQICLAVKHLHNRRILHRDLKSQNVFLTKNNIVKLGDFGLATALRHTWQQAHTLCGTPNYFSPELVAGRPYNNKTDIWAMGCILYELLAQRFAFAGNTLTEIMQNIQCDQPTPVPPHYSEGLRAILSRMLCKEQAIRPSIEALMRAKILQSSLLRIIKENEAGHAVKPAVVKAQVVDTPAPPDEALESPNLPYKEVRDEELTKLENDILSGIGSDGNWLTDASKLLNCDESDKETCEEFGDDTLELVSPSPQGRDLPKRHSASGRSFPMGSSSRIMEKRDSLGNEIEDLLAEFQRLDNVINDG
eukprot:TRINITY_DN42354_c0_g1_i1.p1 TRINITY_DN42354_c0_g1~~TRINITY_DN42354_c0_g1_i1.p1  ORF type:complete len:426 (+),score=87.31 TRINITY_DN42354_c0_g1_i1:51-1328(+)